MYTFGRLSSRRGAGAIFARLSVHKSSHAPRRVAVRRIVNQAFMQLDHVTVCMCVHSYLPPHVLESQKRDTNEFIAIQGSFKILLIFLKMLYSKVMASYAYLDLFRRPKLFPPRSKLLC